MDPAAHDGDVTMGAQSNNSSTATTPTPSQIQRQSSGTSAASKSRPRNVRGLSIAPTPISHTTSTSSYASLGESASVIAAQRGGLSATPGTPRLNAGGISRPGTPSFGRAPTPHLGPPRTPGVGYVPLTPITPAGVAFSPNTPLFSPNALPASKTSKLKSQLTSFLPAKHTYFHAKITVEQLSSVPFVGGEFGVRWKFKSVHRHAAAQQEEAPPEEGQGIFGRMTGKSKGGSAKDKGKAREHAEVNEFGGYLPQQQGSVASTTTTSSTDTATTSESSSSAWSSTSMSSVSSMSSAATKTGTSSSTPSTNLSRNFYSPYASASTTTMSPTSREAQYGPSQYLFNVTPAADGPSPSSTASTSSDPSPSLLFSPNAQSFSSNAAHGPAGALSPMSPGFNIVSPTGTVRIPGRPINGSSAVGGNAPLGSVSQPPAQIGHLSTARGMTQYLPLKDHSITFKFPLEAIVKMDVNRSAAPAHTSDAGVEGAEGAMGLGSELNPHDPHSHSSTSISSMMSPGLPPHSAKPNLQPSPLKLVVMQRVVPDDPTTVPQNPRLGAVFINLAEYVGKGKVERRYLLKESRVNATLKLTIEVNYMSGYQGYIAPPLPKAEIQGGIEGFLKQHDTLLSKKKVKTMGASAVARDPMSTDRGKGIDGDERGDEGAAQTEFEVDLLRRDFLEGEKDRIGEVLVGHIKAVEPGLHVGGQNAAGGTGANNNLNPRADFNPYELPSESESESEYGNRLSGVENGGRQMTAEALGRKQWMQQLRAKKKEETAKRLMLDLSESEDDGIFESADEGLEDDDSQIVPANGTRATEPGGHATQEAHIRVAAFDVQRLPLAYGPKTTESLIEALFNPGFTTDKTDDDPFVMYVSPTELKRQDDWRREEEDRTRQMQRQLSARQNQQQQPRDDHHWYRRPSRSATVEENGTGFVAKLKKGVKRAGTIDSTTSASTTSGSGSGDSPDGLTRLKSPGEDTVVGVRMGEDTDVTSPATITAWSPTRDGQNFTSPGMAVDREATIGKGAGGGGAAGFAGIFSSYQRTKTKMKDRMAGGKGRTKVVEEASVLGGAFYDQEPGDMYAPLGHEGRAQVRAHQRSATGGTVSSTTSSSSLSSLGLSSHGHNPVVQAPAASGSLVTGTTANVRRSTSTRSSTSTGDGHLMMAPSARPDFSAPPGRMDKTGVVKGAGPSLVGDQALEEGGGAGGGLKGWWKGLQR